MRARTSRRGHIRRHDPVAVCAASAAVHRGASAVTVDVRPVTRRRGGQAAYPVGCSAPIADLASVHATGPWSTPGMDAYYLPTGGPNIGIHDQALRAA